MSHESWGAQKNDLDQYFEGQIKSKKKQKEKGLAHTQKNFLGMYFNATTLQQLPDFWAFAQKNDMDLNLTATHCQDTATTLQQH